MRRKELIAVATAAGVLATAGFASTGNARDVRAAFPCPPDPKTQPLGKSAANRPGFTFCNDGAKATAIVAGKKLTFTGGVCWKSKDGFSVGIGTELFGKRKKGDPPVFHLQDLSSGLGSHTVLLAKGTVTWSYSVAINRKKHTFAGKSPVMVGAKLTYVSLTGSYTCKRVLDAPKQ
jgi:hypothetical protein